MKNEIKKIATFICMVVVLGTQALLRGTWRMQEPEQVRRD